MTVPVVVLASGQGTNLDAILRRVRAGALAAEVRAVVTDRKDAGVLQVAKQAGVQSSVVSREDFSTRAEHDQAVLEAALAHQPVWLVLAGYMRILPPQAITSFDSKRGYSRIINIHPSLLPAFPGVDSYAQAFHHGVKVTGVTVHLVDDGLDSGAICAQRAFGIEDCSTLQEVTARGLAIEHQLYSETLAWVLPERFEVTSTPTGRLCVRQS